MLVLGFIRSSPSSSRQFRNACSAAPVHHVRHGAATSIKILATVDYARAPQRSGRGDLHRLRSHPDRLAELLPYLPRRAQADLRRRHHSDRDRGGALNAFFNRTSREQAEAESCLWWS